MRYFLDTEFIENGPGRPIELISIGFVAEDGRTYYAVSNQWTAADGWVAEHVLPKLEDQSTWKPLYQIRDELLAFFEGDPKPEIWGYYADYDWVVFCQIFGRMVDLPPRFPKFCRDVIQLCKDLGNPPLPKQPPEEAHHALKDAWDTRRKYEYLQKCLTLKSELAK